LFGPSPQLGENGETVHVRSILLIFSPVEDSMPAPIRKFSVFGDKAKLILAAILNPNLYEGVIPSVLDDHKP
jgi:hypothetical protein